MLFNVEHKKKNRRNTHNSYKKRKADGFLPKEHFHFWKARGRILLFDFLLVLVAFIAVIGVAIGSLKLYDVATTSDFFATTSIEIKGNTRLSREIILQYVGLHVGNNSLAVSIAKMEQQLLATPWVEEVAIKRQLPGHFSIYLKERMPSFWVRREGILYYANASGEPIAPVEDKNFLALPVLEVEEGAEDELPYLSEYIDELRDGGLPLEFGNVSVVTLSLTQGVEIYLEDRSLRLSISTKDWKKNIKRMDMTLSDLAKRRELGNIREVRVSDDSVWVLSGEKRS